MSPVGYYAGSIFTFVRRYITAIVAAVSRLRRLLSSPRRLLRTLASTQLSSIDGLMATFDMVVVGCGGGPNESNLSFYLLKAGDARWEDGIVALEGGSGLGALTRLLDAQPGLFASEKTSSDVSSALTTAANIYDRIRCYVVTHAHLDHVNGLVLCAGSGTGAAKVVYGAQGTLQTISTIFSGQVWPKLASWADAEQPASCLLLSPLPSEPVYTPIARDISVRLMPISHGQHSPGQTYPCSAYFVRHDPSAREFLFFGDVEPDSVSLEPRNRDVWRAAAPKIPDTLSAIFIECSYPSGRADALLYGHLSSEHLVQELCALAVEVVSSRQRLSLQTASDQAVRKKKRPNTDSLPDLRGSLAGLCVYIIHCKEDLHCKYAEPMHTVIASQVRELVDAKGLGAEIIATQQGMHIRL